MVMEIEVLDASSRTAQLVSELVGLWERSVRASHHFLTDGDIVGLLPFVKQGLAEIQWQPTMGAEWGSLGLLSAK